MFNKDVKVPLHEMELVGTSSSNNEDILMVLRGELADMMVQIVPQIYRKYVTVDRKGTPILYVGTWGR